MENCRQPAIFVVVAFLLSAVVDQSRSIDSVTELNVEIAEELAVGTVVADLAAGGAGLDVGRDAPEFTMVSGSFERYFRIGAADGGEQTSAAHLLIVDRTIDRDVICKHR